MYRKFEDMSREELIEVANRQAAGILTQGNRPAVSPCPFCGGMLLVPLLKKMVKAHLIEEWHKDVTREEEEAFTETLHGRLAQSAPTEGPVQ